MDPNHPDQDASSIELSGRATSTLMVDSELITTTDVEDEDARKARINSELVQILQTPSLPGRTASVQGFGVYTHARIKRTDELGLPQDTVETIFLPVGGPSKVRKDNSKAQEPVDAKVQKAWSVIEHAVGEEETALHLHNINIEKLKERYGALDMPNQDSTAQSDPRVEQQQQFRQVLEYLRRVSYAGQTSGDVTMDDTGREITGSNPPVSIPSQVAPSTGNIYHQERDPRKR
ncbi:hypothetical protein DE146DRAFT_640784 [Phaeosphaeria sp. MPI-PUGE-AT-0046c]|nr:hypothetical protein DE146DRAFT_640784 [Phaeosphaeria sp. MPI-PUGE-AT-0046c]